MIKFREQRGGLQESLETTVELETPDDLVKYIQSKIKPYGREVRASNIHVYFYAIEERAPGWEDMHIVTINGYGVIGFTDKFVEV